MRFFTVCLNVIGAFIAWIEVSLIANEKFIPLIVAGIKIEETQEAAADCICSILQKGMDSRTKFQLISAIDDYLIKNGVFDLLLVRKMKF